MSWRNLIWMAVILCLAGLCLYLARRQPPQVRQEDPVVKDLAGALRAYETVNRHALRPLTPGRATAGAIEGMVRRVDEYSVYLPPGAEAPFWQQFKSELNDTGLRLAEENGRLYVLGALPGSPAQKFDWAGGPTLVRIDDTPASDLTLAAARKLAQTPAADEVTVVVKNAAGVQTPRTLARAKFVLPTVTGLATDSAGRPEFTLDEPAGLYYLRISEFTDRTPEELRAAYRQLDEPRGLVLDVRGNPGGALAPAVEVADLFLAEGLIVRTEYHDGAQQARYAHANGTLPPLPLVVLIDGQTASAAEIVAGSLQAHNRALLLGARSYGKWCVQTTVPLPYGLGEAYLTTGRYFLAERATTLPATRPASATRPVTTAPADRQGLEPDVTVPLTPRAAERLELLRLMAAVALPPARAGDSETARLEQLKGFRAVLIQADPPLAKGLRLLREERVPATQPAPATLPAAAPAGRPALETNP